MLKITDILCRLVSFKVLEMLIHLIYISVVSFMSPYKGFYERKIV